MNFTLDKSQDKSQRSDCSIEDLARVICRYMKYNIRINGWSKVGLKDMRESLGTDNPSRDIAPLDFSLKFYEAVARLKHRGILMDCDIDTNVHYVCFTSVGAKTDFDDELLILIDDAFEVVQALKEKIPNLDSVVEQYYLESLRTCQNGFYISSVISLGAASERTINCLAETVSQLMQNHKNDIDSKRSIYALTRYLVDNSAALFKSLDATLRNELKERLTGLANIYRLNRNDAGHPSSVPQDWARDEQECYLSQFRRLAVTCFKAIDELNGVSAGNAPI